MTKTGEDVVTIEHVIGPRVRFTLRQASGEITIRGVAGESVRVRSLAGGKPLDEEFHI